jgi:hypothetical protein
VTIYQNHTLELCERQTRRNKNIKNIDNSQKGYLRALQVTTHLGLAILSELRLVLVLSVLEMFVGCELRSTFNVSGLFMIFKVV